MSEYTWLMVYEFVISIFTGFIAYHLGKRYREKRNKIIQYIFLFTAFSALAIISAALSLIIRILKLRETVVALNFEGLVFAVIFIAISSIFLLQYGLVIFHPDLEKQKKLLIISVFGALMGVFIICVLLTGMYTEYLTTGIWIFLVTLAFTWDVYILVGSFRMDQRLFNPLDLAFVLMIFFVPIFLDTVIFISISNIFLLQFGLAIFHPDLKKQKKMLIITVFAVLTVAFVNYALLTGTHAEDLTTSIWIFLVILALSVDLIIFIGSFRMIRRLSDRVDKAFVLMILFAPIFLVFEYIFFFLDILKGGNFTIFYYFGWLAGVIAANFLYIGVLRPKFLEKRLRN